MADAKTVPTETSVAEFVAGVDHAGRREDAVILDALFRQATGWTPRMWGSSIIGYGRYDYTYESGHSGTCQATGFSPRKGNMVLYIMPGYADFSEILGRLGKHKTGACCLYLGRLKGIDLDVLSELIQAGLADLGAKWPVFPE